MKIKGSTTTSFVTFMIIVCSMIIVMEIGVGWHVWSSKESVNLFNNYYITEMDKSIQSMKQGFLKTAAFFSINTVSKELALHGGYAASSLSDAENSNSIADISESKEPKIYIEDGLPYWSTQNCGDPLKRVPYLKDADVNFAAGDQLIVLMYNDNDHAQYIEEINSALYPLYASVQLFMLKPGTVDITCELERGCASMEPVGSTPPQITKDGVYQYRITRINPDAAATALHITARNTSGGIDNIVRVKQVTASIYDPAIIKTPDELFTDELAEYYSQYYGSEDSVLKKRNAESEIKLEIAPLSGTLTKASYEGGFTEGMVWPDEQQGGITAYMDDVFFSDRKLAEIRDSGLVTEGVKLRYYKLYGYAEKFTDISEALLRYRLWKKLDTLEDTSNPSSDPFCDRVPCKPSCDMCPPDTVKSYTGAEIESAVNDALWGIENDLLVSTHTEGIEWKLELSEFDTNATGTPMPASCDTNRQDSACSTVEECNSNNLEYYEYTKGRFVSEPGCCGSCNPAVHTYSSSCSHGSSDAGPGHPSDCSSARPTTCSMNYRHRYVLKNLKIKVTITDTKYKYYDTETGDWQELKFSFYIAAPLVDDNCCGGRQCDDMVSECAIPPAKSVTF